MTDAAAAILPVAETPTLVAYFQAFVPGDTSAKAVREQFLAVAPGHLAGAELIAVDRIPRRSDGSIDLVVLPAPGSAQQTSSDEYLAPRDELESSLVAIWEDVLGVRPIGVRTSFFKLGGYSLMIVRLFARINKALNTTLSPSPPSSTPLPSNSWLTSCAAAPSTMCSCPSRLKAPSLRFS